MPADPLIFGKDSRYNEKEIQISFRSFDLLFYFFCDMSPSNKKAPFFVLLFFSSSSFVCCTCNVVMRFSQLDERGLPLVVEPERENESSISFLCSWIKQNKEELDEKLLNHGAILFRGYNVPGPEEFEKAALSLEPNLREDYLGTSARRKLTKFVYTASEMPPYFPIPQHCEMSFTKHFPSRIFFYCITPSKINGETPLCDHQEVYQSIDPVIRDKWEKKGIKYYRSYNHSKTSSWDPVSVKNWDEVFETSNKPEIEKICKEEDYSYKWLPGDKLRLENLGPAVKSHPTSNKKVWFNHAHIFHPSSQYDEFARMAKWLPRHKAWSLLFVLIGWLMFVIKFIFFSPEEGAMYCTFSDGTPIPRRELTHVRDAIWKNMVIQQWKKGDMLAKESQCVHVQLVILYNKKPFMYFLFKFNKTSNDST